MQGYDLYDPKNLRNALYAPRLFPTALILFYFQLSGGFPALIAVGIGKLGMAKSASFLHRCHYFETAPSQNFFQCPHNTSSLIHNDVKRPHRAARRDNNCFLALMKCYRHSHTVFAHHSIHNAVEKQFQSPRDITPIAWRSYHKRIASHNHSQNALRIILRHYTFSGRAACHTCHARADSQLRHFHHIYLSPTIQGFLLYHFEHLRYITGFPRARIDNQNIHINIH